MEGACRAADGSAGEYTYAHVSSQYQCQTVCDEDLSCVAYEYTFHAVDPTCEIHSLEIVRSNGGSGVDCFVKQTNSGEAVLETGIPKNRFSMSHLCFENEPFNLH